MIAKLYIKSERYAAAIAMARKAVKLEPDNAYGHYILGFALSRSGDRAAARKELPEVRKRDAGMAEDLDREIRSGR